ncbi:hypothetical protein [Acidovorax sp. sic0104]|uniref:hypothetical protein n=1 Tax=Acidovorax sp. sic0104 TaxID=2854784 RepID=UPI001C43F575|nr:hypothetical protein [Acidovorax sp. sic0104]MBV7542695.1 hypothetical protein [Acidovorax sp. sic0104]
MINEKQAPEYNQYGLKDSDARVVDVYANRPGGEEPAVGPTDAVTSSGHRVGAIEQHPDPKPSSRAGQKVFGEVDDKKR